jgi:hypothetical protein
MTDKPFVTKLTLSQEKCVIKHAREIFTKIVQVGHGVTAANVKGIEASAESALSAAELFQRKLMEAGYGIREEDGQRIELSVGPSDLNAFPGSQSGGYPTVLGDGLRNCVGQCGAACETPVCKKDPKG